MMDSTSLDPRLRENVDTSPAPLTHDATIKSDATNHHQQPPTPYSSGPTGGSAAFSPQTPSSAASNHRQNNSHATPDENGDHSQDGTPLAGAPGGAGPGALEKKARACESCRGLKVRCEPDPANPSEDGACKRCAKAGRACIVTQPTRKRQKKTDSRVAELEKKIDALTASLHASRGGGAGVAGGQGSPKDEHTGGTDGGYDQLSSLARWATQHAQTGTPQPVRERALQPQAQHTPTLGRSPGMPTHSLMDIDTGKAYQPPMVMAGQKRKYTEPRDSVTEGTLRDVPPPAAAPTGGSMGHEYSDAIDRGVLSMAKAEELWVRYTDYMAPHLPGVVFPSSTTAADIRKTKPILFLAIMAASSSELPSVQRTLTKELMQIIADKVVVVGEKSLELVQALHVAVMWYWPPEHFEELKFYQLVHIAAVMAIDIGLGRKKASRGGMRKHMPVEWRAHSKKHPLPDPTSIEARRAWLTCYFLATNTSMALHRPNLIRWNSFMTECVDILESSPEVAPTDKYLCHLVWTHKLAEDVGIQFAMDDPATTINIADTKTQYTLRGFERDLDKYKSSIPEELRQPSLLLSFHVLNLYMHEIATQTDGNDERPMGYSVDNIRDALASDAPLTPAHISALSACLTAIDGIIEVFLSMDVRNIRCLPVFNFVRVAYAVVVLIKMYFAASSPKSELGKVINKDHMKVEQHLDKLLDKFGATAADDKSRPASKFLVVLVMLRSWFQKQKANGGSKAGEIPAPPACADFRGMSQKINSPPTNQSQTKQQDQPLPQQQHPDYSTTANTPLQLLSEIATNDSNNPGTTGSSPRPNNPRNFFWNRGIQQTPQPFMYDDTASTNTMTNNANDSSSTPQTNASSLTPGTAPSSAPSAAFPLLGNAGIPWLNPTDFDYAGLGLGDGFAQAMDLTLTGLADGSMMGIGNGGYDDGTGRYFFQDASFYPGGVASALDGTPGAGAAAGGGGGVNGGVGGAGTGGVYQF